MIISHNKYSDNLWFLNDTLMFFCRYSKTIFSFASELLINHAKCIQMFSLKFWEQKPNGRRQSSYITEKFDQGMRKIVRNISIPFGITLIIV